MKNLLNVLNTADRMAAAQTNFQRLEKTLAYGPQPTEVGGVPNVLEGPPVDGAWEVGAIWVDKDSYTYMCTAAGTPGTWVLVSVPATPVGANCRFKARVGWQIYDVAQEPTPWRTLRVIDGEIGLDAGEA